MERGTEQDAGKRQRLWLLLVPASITVWLIIRTELRVAELRDQGFTEVVIDSTRDHAYFPLIGAMLGTGIGIAVAKGIRRLLTGSVSGAR